MKALRAFVARTLRSIVSKFSYRFINSTELEQLREALAAAGRVNVLPGTRESRDLRAIVFSRDRPLQLHALLGSYFDQFDQAPPVRVMYSTSSDRVAAAYSEVARLFPNRDLQLVRETDFRLDLLKQLEDAGDGRLFFLVDDIVFLEPVAVADLMRFPIATHILSLRLAPRITFSYTTQKSEKPPAFAKISESSQFSQSLLEWEWKDGEIDWGYAFSVDGHVLHAAEILELARAVSFRAPNSFESAMQIFAPYFAARKGLCYERPVLVNIPCNRVQNEVDNVHGEMHQDRLLEYWEAGQRVDFQKLYGTETTACHQEIVLPLYTPTEPGQRQRQRQWESDK